MCGCLAAWLMGLDADQDVAPPAVTFRSGVEIVDVDVSVLDRNRIPVRGLTAADFTVLEDGRPRPVVAFSAVDLPGRESPTARWLVDVAPDVADNAVGREGRLVVILMDRSIGFENLPQAVTFAEAAVDQLRPGDMAAVAYSTLGVPQNFTADRARLLGAIRQPTVGLPQGDPGSPAECFCGTCSLESVATIAEAMLPVRQRRKVLLFIGTNISMQSSSACGGLLSPLRARAERALEAANMTVHSYDPSGLQTLAQSASQTATASYRNTAMAAMNRRGNLRALPDHTGGRVVSDPVRPADRVAELFRESHAYYVLGFQPTAASAPGRFRRIEVKVARQDVIIQARRGYYTGGAMPAPARRGDRVETTAPLPASVVGLWPKTDVAMTLVAAPVGSPRMDAVTVMVVVGAEHQVEAGPPSPAGVAASTINAFVGAFDRNGRAVASARQTVAVTPRQVGSRAVDYEVAARLELRPGRYELRASVEDAAMRQAGSVYGYLDVPDYRREAVAMSGLLLTVQPARPSVPAAPFLDLVPVTPTARRHFTTADTVSAFVRVSQGLSRAMVPGYILADVVNEQGQSVFRQETRVLAEQFGAGRATDFSVELPIASLGPGQYLLSVEARHGTVTARRHARFRIVP